MSRVGREAAIRDPRLLGAALGDLSTWATWIVVLKAAFALALAADETALFKVVAGNRAPPTQRVRQLWAIAGRRSGKSRVAALIACYLALFARHRLARGEVGTVLVLAASQAQARTVFDYVKGFLDASAALRREVAAVTQQEITLRNGIVIAVHANSFRTVRGKTCVAAIFDEAAWWRDDTSANPDLEVYRAVMPSLATTNGMLVGISTPYRKVGLLHQKHRDHYGQDSDDVLVVQGSSQTFNSTLSDETIATQRAADPLAASSEWDALFRIDVSSYLDDRQIEQAVEIGRPLELPPMLHFGGPTYQAFTDSAGGVGSDSYTLAVAHREDDLYVLDLVRGTEGIFNPQEVTKQYAAVLKDYHLSTVTGDHYAASWVSSAWQECGISYVKSELPKSQIYLEVLPCFSRGLGAPPGSPEAAPRAEIAGTPHPPFRQGYRRPWPGRARRLFEQRWRGALSAQQPRIRCELELGLGSRRFARGRRLARGQTAQLPARQRGAAMSERDTTTLRELRRDVIAALWVLAVVTAGAFAVMALLH
jgi:hypothetical protein